MLQRTMKSIGLRDVELLGAPADGITQAGYWTMPLAWEARSARLEIVEPIVAEKFRVLADYASVPASLGMWSGPTPRQGLVAEVIEAKEVTDSQDWKGKIVLTRENPAGLKWLLVRKGAAGAINGFTENPDLQDDRQWINAWGDRGWGFTKGNTPLPCFSIARRLAEVLREGQARIEYSRPDTASGALGFAAGFRQPARVDRRDGKHTCSLDWAANAAAKVCRPAQSIRTGCSPDSARVGTSRLAAR